MRCRIILLTSLLLCHASWASDRQAVIFIDSGDPLQATLIADINKAFFYSPTLRNMLTVKVFDINTRSLHFTGEIEYQIDSDGKAVATYRPGRLPYIFCQRAGKIEMQYTLSNKDQICFYSKEG